MLVRPVATRFCCVVLIVDGATDRVNTNSQLPSLDCKLEKLFDCCEPNELIKYGRNIGRVQDH